MTAQLHLAAQYLAAAGISFVDKKEDDSHTNLGFSIEKRSLITRNLDKKPITLSLNYQTFGLEWNDNESIAIFLLDGKTHNQVLEWINSMASKSKLSKSYIYDLHYELPYQITDDYIFKLEDADNLQKLKEQRILANTIIEEFLNTNNLEAEIRIWPHHFDTGAFVPSINASGISIGLGMAIPDTMIDDYYFYISGYHGHDGVDTSDFKKLSIGTWKNNGFKGAVLPITGIEKEQGINFLNEALTAYKS
ncbi:hypothetical protein [uncultured Aquimarina sp.]|uniref:hypothetical protein n=1 Tax=uncultured Aquimarina sp. TaxID=575652 RepID=UPI002626DD35|nr:hypothetical protein [uncultured Aquimarina sp.]